MSVWTIRLDPRTGKPIGYARRLGLSGGRGAAFSPDGRYVAFSVIPATDTVAPRIAKVPVGGGPEQIVARESGWAQSLRWSPDGKWIYYRHGARSRSGAIRTLRRVAADGGAPAVIVEMGDLIGISPDGRSLAYLARETPRRVPRKIVVIANDRGEELRRFALPRDVMPLDWGSDRSHILALRSRARTGIRFVDLAGQIKDLTPAAGFDSWPSIAPDGKRLAVRTSSDHRDHYTIVDLTSGQRRAISTATEPSVGAALWSPDGTQLAFFSDDGRAITTVDLNTNRERRVAECPERIHGMWPRRSQIMYFCWRGAAIELRTTTANGSVLVRSLPVSPSERVDVRLANDSTLVLLSDKRIIAMPVHGGPTRTLYTVLDGETLRGSGISLSPDHEWIAFIVTRASGNQQAQDFVRVIPLGEGAARFIPLPPLGYGGSVGWDPQRRYLTLLAEQLSPRTARADAWLVPLDGSPTFPLTGLDPIGIVGGAAFTPDGTGLVYTSAGPVEQAILSINISPSPGRKPPIP